MKKTRHIFGSPRSVRVHGYDDFYWDDPLAFLGGSVLALLKFIGTSKTSPAELDLNIEDLDRL
jgi:hypothetical protein